MSPIIRKMRHSDLAPLAALRHVAFFADGKHSQEADIIALGGLLDGDDLEVGLVAEVDGKPVGSCLLVREEIDPLHDLSPWLAGLIVAESHRGQGLGRVLVEAIEQHAKAVGCKDIYLYTDAAEALYAKLGWIVVERMLVDSEPLVLMQRKF